ncbi:MAG: plastocyanin/azurin family copper-binding protein [Chloroflexota bacterium]|nr:plastocyanin/azurin family copper-binding protein [Chloroflexota bacterium]
MRRPLIPLLAVLAVTLAACSSPGAAGTASPSSGGSPRVVAVTMTDEFRFVPAQFSFSAGDTVRFEVTNAGTIQHEFFIGDTNAQGAHEAEMVDGGMAHDEPNGISVDPGGSKVLEHTFAAAGAVVIGCHEPGHYDAGMVATVSVD